MKTAIITDSGSSFTKEEAQALGIFYLPHQISINNEVKLDGIEISLEDLHEHLHQEATLGTSQPPLGYIEEVMHQIKKEGYDEAVAVTICPGLSSTLSTLRATFKYNDLPLHYVDTFTTCRSEKYLATCAKTLADKGYNGEEIVKRLNESIACSNTLIVPSDLQHLKRGGRLTPIAATLGGLLKIKPILKLNKSSEGKIDVYAKVRTMSKALQTTVDTFKDENLDENYIMYVLHTDAFEECQTYYELMKEAFPKTEIIFGEIGAVISVHTGIGCVGAQYLKKVNLD
ncbi:MAG: DegV family protein [Erysipelotrichaceae bacterium]